MKKFLYLLLINIVCITPLLLADVCNSCNEPFSQSFMYTRPITQHVGINDALWHDILYTKHGDLHAAVQMTAAFQESVDDIPSAHYFLLPCKSQLLVAGDAITNDLNRRDMRAEWLGLPADFRGNFSLHPKQRQMAFFIEANQDLGRLCNNYAPFKNSWVGLIVPVVGVENNITIRQCNITNPGTSDPTDIIEAFNQPSWMYSKINGPSCQFMIADLTFKLGNTFYNDNDFLFAAYTSLVFPTGNKQNAEFLFDAVAGSNAHFGYGAGANIQLLLNRDCAKIDWLLFLNLEGIFYAHNTQMRTFDLVGKPLSRYMQFIERNAPEPNVLIPGVNILTQRVQVHPYGIFDFSGGFRWHYGCTELEFGYNIWGKGPEKLFLRCPFPPDRWGIAGSIDPQTGEYGTASHSTINRLAPNDTLINDTDIIIGCCEPTCNQPVFVPISVGDLDFDSCRGHSAFNHKVHISVGYVYCGCKIDGFFGAGIFYDLPMKNSCLALMGGWAKVGASF